jgi:hypothetical protein
VQEKTVTVAEISKMLDVPVNTVRDRIIRQNCVPVASFYPLRVRLTQVLENWEALKHRDGRGRKSATAALRRFA